MKFLFLVYSHERGLAADGGGFRKPWRLAEALIAQGHRVHVLGPRPPFSTSAPFTSLPRIPLPILRPLAAYGAQFLLGLLHRPDVVYFRSSLSPLPVLLARLLGARSLMEINGDAAGEAHRDGRPLRARLIRLIEGFNARRASKIVALTKGLGELAVARGAPPDRVLVLPSATDADHFKPGNREDARRALGLPVRVPLIGFVGVFYRHQGVDTLLKAAPLVLKEFPEALFLLIGDGPARKTWEALAKELGIIRSVRFTGQIPYDALPPYLAALDVAAAPFTADRGETSPLKVMDAWAAEIPVAISDLPSLSPLLAEMPPEVRLPPDNPSVWAAALTRLLRDPGRRALIGKQGRSLVLERYNWPSTAARLARTLSLNEDPHAS